MEKTNGGGGGGGGRLVSAVCDVGRLRASDGGAGLINGGERAFHRVAGIG